MKTTTNPIETCQSCGQGIYPAEAVLVLGTTVEESRAIHLHTGCFMQYKRGPELVRIVRVMTVEGWLEL